MNNKFIFAINLACGGTFTSSTLGEFASPNYPDSSPLNTYCIWKILASAGNKMTMTITKIDIPRLVIERFIN